MADVSAVFRGLDVVGFQGVDGYQCSIGELSRGGPAGGVAVGDGQLERIALRDEIDIRLGSIKEQT